MIVTITPGWTEGVAALLYNILYDPSSGQRWTLTHKSDDEQWFLAFAEGLLHALQADDLADDRILASYADLFARHKLHTGVWSEVLVIDQKYISLSSECEKHMHVVKNFLNHPFSYDESELVVDVGR